MQSQQFVKRKLSNLLHSLLLFAGLILLFAVIGWVVSGITGVIFLGAFAIFMFLFTRHISPHIVLRAYRARPLAYDEAPRLISIVAGLAKRAGLPRPPQVYYIPSQMVNAFSVGRRDDAAIGVTDGLLNNLNLNELAGVLAHEISHIRNNDLYVMGLADMVNRTTSTLSLFGQFLFFLNLPLMLMGGKQIPWLVILILVLAPMLSSLLQLGLSRSREYDADLDAARLTGDPRGLASALVKLEQLHAGFLERILLPGRRVPEPSLLRTHPKTEDRIRRLLELEERKEPEDLLPGLYSDADTLAEQDMGIVSDDLRQPRWRYHGFWY